MRAATTPHKRLGNALARPGQRELEARRLAQVRAAVAQRARDLLDEQRVAAAAQAGELGEAGFEAARRELGEAPRVRRAERAEREALHRQLRRPSRRPGRPAALRPR